ncbi:MAG: permease [archaeon]
MEEIILSFVSSVLRISAESRLAETITFFVYDSIKILFLLVFMISIIGYLRTYISNEKLQKSLSKSPKGLSHIFASIFGAVTPFCSCSSIPIFMSFIKSGVPLGVAFSFLITSPLVNEYVAVIMLATFGWKIALAYVASGVFIGVFVGMFLGSKNLDNQIEKEFRKVRIPKDKKYSSIKERLLFGVNESKNIVKSMWARILIGVGIGAILHGYIPSEKIQSFISAGGIFSVPIAVIIGVPLYANCAAIVPVALVLFQKGIPLGTTLAFMMATAALSLPEAVILRRIMKLRLIALFFAVVSLGIIFIGYLFNFLQGYLI